MNTFNVSFDLMMERVDPQRNYDSFFEELKATDHIRVWQTNWLIATDETGPQLRNRLMQHLHKNDQVLVSIVNKEWAGFIATPALRWLQDRLKQVEETVAK